MKNNSNIKKLAITIAVLIVLNIAGNYFLNDLI